MKTSELRKAIREEIQNVLREAPATPAEKFLVAFNFQPFDDWYKMYTKHVEGNLEPGDPDYEEFIEDTQYIMTFLSKALMKSK